MIILNNLFSLAID